MSAFHETIKQILAEVDRFLNSTLKNESLSKPAQKEKAKILDSLQKIYEEYEVLNPNLDLEDGSSSSSRGVADESRFTTTSNLSHGSHASEEEGYSDNIQDTTIKALKDPVKIGYLLKKPSDLLEKLSKSKKYCVIHNNVLYWFKKPGDKKEQGAVFLSGYEVKDLSQNNKEFLLELFSSKKKCHQFQPDSKEDLEEWKKAFEVGIGTDVRKPSLREEDELLDSGEEYEDINEIAKVVRGTVGTSSTEPVSPPTRPPHLPPTPPQAATESITSQQLPPLPLPSPPEESSTDDIYDEGESMAAAMAVEPEEIYEDVGQFSSPTSGEVDNDDDNKPKVKSASDPPGGFFSARSAADPPRSSVPISPPPRPPSPNWQPPPSSPPPLPQRGPNIPAPSLPVTPPVVTKRRLPKLDKTASSSLLEDYENIFLAVWSCIGGGVDELSFERGDEIHILNRDFDSESWWVGEKGDQIGLVPKWYLCPAYELVV